jgi:hypothetical protein
MRVMGTSNKCWSPWQDENPRSLREAARLASEIVLFEHLPIPTEHDALHWHAEAMLKTIPVYGIKDNIFGAIAKRDGRKLDPELASVDGWRDLRVARADFDAYMKWLLSAF